MEKSTINKLLLIGNHALLINKSIKKIDDLALIKQTLMYKTGYPFLEKFDNFVQIDNVKHSYKYTYNFDDLTHFLKLKFKEIAVLDSPALIIGNPSELLFQSALTALLENENKAVKSSIIILLYPIGMVGHDTRKELSGLIYLLKKNAIQTLLIRNSKT